MNRTLNSLLNFMWKYKVLHIVYWVWSFLNLVHVQDEHTARGEPVFFEATIIILFQMLCVYFMVYFLMPKFLNQKKYFKFLLFVSFSFLLTASLLLLVSDIETLVLKGRHLHSYNLPIMFLSRATDLVIVQLIFFAVYTIKDRYYAERRHDQLEKEKLKAEVDFLKAQMNPHFVFNAINSIYVLIEENKKLASQSLLKFSSLLRYQLYDCSSERMPLGRELQFLKDYVDLEKMRSEEGLQVRFDVHLGNESLQIAPFILTPFVENAFKHKSSDADDSYVKIKAEISNKELHFSVINTYEEEREAPLGEMKGGIGLHNVTRRLELLYPGRHTLEVKKTEAVFSIHLKLDLNENEMYPG